MRYTSRRPCEGPHPIMKSPSLSSLGDVANDRLTTCNALSEDTGAMPHGSQVARSSKIQGLPANIRKQGPNSDRAFCPHPRTNALSISGQNLFHFVLALRWSKNSKGGHMVRQQNSVADATWHE